MAIYIYKVLKQVHPVTDNYFRITKTAVGLGLGYLSTVFNPSTYKLNKIRYDQKMIFIFYYT